MNVHENKKQEQQINAHLAALHPDKRPMAANGFRIQSVAYSAKGAYEATTSHGHIEYVKREVAAGWLK